MSEIDNKRVHLLTRNLLSSEPRVRCGAGIHATAELKAVRSARFGEVTCRACIRRGAQLGEMCFEAVDSLKQLLAIREAGEAHEEQGS